MTEAQEEQLLYIEKQLQGGGRRERGRSTEARVLGWWEGKEDKA